MSENSQTLEPASIVNDLFKIDVKIGERNYEFNCHRESPLSEVHSAICQIKDWCEEKARELDNQMKEKQELVKDDQELPVLEEMHGI